MNTLHLLGGLGLLILSLQGAAAVPEQPFTLETASGKVEGTVQRVFIPDERRPSVQAALRITAYKNRTELAGSIEFV